MFGPKLKREQYQGLQCGQDLFQDRCGILISFWTGMSLRSVPLPVGTCFRICMGTGSVPAPVWVLSVSSGMSSGAIPGPVRLWEQF